MSHRDRQGAETAEAWGIDPDRVWPAVEAGDPRFDGWVFLGVKTTRIYCRPSCPARTPKREHVRFFATAAAAQAAGFRACLRCRPDAAPGSPEWDSRADLVGRAMRSIADGVIDRDGVEGLARRLGYASRHVHRQLVSVVGVGPLALARAQRAQTARILLETTDVSVAEIALAAGFGSVRQFNDTIAQVFALTPTELRRRSGLGGRSGVGGRSGRGGLSARGGRSGRRPSPSSAAATIDRGDGAADRAPRAQSTIILRLPYRAPFDGRGAIEFLARRAVPGIEEVSDGAYRRGLRLPHGRGFLELRPGEGQIQARYWLEDLRDLSAAVQRSRTLLDLDSDPESVRNALEPDPLLGALVRAAPGRRVLGHVDGHELAVRAILGQQVSIAGARTLAGRLARDAGERLPSPIGSVTHLFPEPEAILDVPLNRFALPRARVAALQALARAVAAGELTLDPGTDRHQARARLLALPGVGPWTAEYVAMRALRDPDAFLPSDLGVRRALTSLGAAGEPVAASRAAERWRPYRAYAVAHLWAYLAGQALETGRSPAAAVTASPGTPAAAA